MESAQLHETPFLYLAGDREFAIPSEPEIEALRRYLTFGGFLLIDSAEGSIDGAFDGSVRALIQAVFPPPAQGLEIVPGDHVVYKSFYLLDRPAGRLAISPVMEGVMRDGRLSSRTCRTTWAARGRAMTSATTSCPASPAASASASSSFRMGVNLVMYSLCLDYKADQVHVPFIMRRRRWRPSDGSDPFEATPPGSPILPPGGE